MTLVYKEVDGDVLDHKHNPTGKIVIPHVVNTLGCMGSGVAAGIRKKWPIANKWYEDWYGMDSYGGILDDELTWTNHKFELGECQFVEVEPDIYVCNMVGQKDIGPNEFGMPPIRMDSLRECIFRLRKFVVENNISSIASCKFGSLRAGGNFEDIKKMIFEIFQEVDVLWITYCFEEKSSTKFLASSKLG